MKTDGVGNRFEPIPLLRPSEENNKRALLRTVVTGRLQ